MIILMVIRPRRAITMNKITTEIKNTIILTGNNDRNNDKDEHTADI